KHDKVILNLVMNACDAMPEGGTLAIRTDFTKLEANEVAPDCKPGRYVRLSVIDEGCGMPPETAERIFEPFFTTKPVGKGTGLGLSTVFADVSNSGGFVTVESRVGEGTAIRVHLPEAEGAIETTDAGAEHASRPVGGNETILVCDDEEVVLASVSRLLQTLGYPVLSANSPQEAIEVAAAYDGPISLLLTDVTMPGMDGIELGKEIRRFYPDIRVVLTSGYAEDVLRGSASEDEHFKFLQKPVPYDVLARTIREVLD
ncbi:MAG: response regulator, partial [Planctomycetes bacterium]|nr:response regulator [Planctomycetota bacterium]